MLFTELHKQLLIECAEDYVGLWSVINEVGSFLKETDALNVREKTLAILTELLEAELIQAGFPTPDSRGFEQWRISAKDVIDRIGRAWDALGREPNIGEIVWFTSTEAGDRKLREWKEQKGQSPGLCS